MSIIGMSSENPRRFSFQIVDGRLLGWGEPPAQRVFQGVSHLMQQGGNPQAISAEAFRRIPGFIDGSDSDAP
jgi:hypothetical protein